ncbi:transcriptional regulator, TetR family [Arthrobacter sp. cf158]|uniref:TetR/AcrR family transcriptional regulator n=1 Tax=Arthrobacter sp. cf158 TaxID=1761744 RepID=UPI000895E871|nr:TetR/AcrR family transcriptional regulator [Arthrobacter sp. cf158]SDW86959.1 transcriptional regulator, TetR family [Arthrobacter sp. cf158]
MTETALSTAEASVGRARGSYAKTESRRREILAAAIDVFSTSGYRSGSMQEIADKIGITKAGLLHHFRSKEALLEAVLTLRDAESWATAGIVTDNGRATLDGIIRLVQHNASVPGLVALHAVLSSESTDPTHPAHAYFQQRYNWLRDVGFQAFSDLQRQGKLREGVAASSAARQLIALLDGLQVQWLLDKTSVDMTAEVKTYLNALTTERF